MPPATGTCSARCASRTPFRTCSRRLKVAAPLSVIYAYVSEYFGGAQDGLGKSDRQQHRQLEECGGLGIRAGRMSVGSDLLPGLHRHRGAGHAGSPGATKSRRLMIPWAPERPIGHQPDRGRRKAMRKQRIKGTLAAAVALSFIAAACGSDDSSSSATEAPAAGSEAPAAAHRGTGRDRGTGRHRGSGRDRGCRRRHGWRVRYAHTGEAATAVGHAGAVRRLLRGGRSRASTRTSAST